MGKIEMQNIFTSLLIFTCTFCYCQIEKIKIKKEVPQDTTSVVTIAGVNSGNCNILKILMDTKLKISNNKTELRIISFRAEFVDRGVFKSRQCNSDSLSKELVKEMMGLDFQKRPKFFIEEIKAINKESDTLFLPPITLNLVK